jgi:hypothetical protein
LRISGIFKQPGNVTFVTIYDIIIKVIAAQRFVVAAFSRFWKMSQNVRLHHFS